MDSTSDSRTANNVLRHEYRVLSEEEKLQVKEIKDLGVDFIQAIRRLSPPGRSSREQSLAVTKIEEAVFWAIKYATGDKE